MGLFDIFKSENKDARLAYLRQLIKVAKADGHLVEEEYSFIKNVAARLETTEQDLEALQQETGKSASLGLQTSPEKLQFIWDLVWVMTVDQTVDVNEVHICSRMAYRLGFETDIVKDMSEHIEKVREPGDSPEEAYRKAFNSFDAPYSDDLFKF